MDLPQVFIDAMQQRHGISFYRWDGFYTTEMPGPLGHVSCLRCKHKLVRGQWASSHLCRDILEQERQRLRRYRQLSTIATIYSQGANRRKSTNVSQMEQADGHNG